MIRLLILFACSLAATVCTAQADPGGPVLTYAGYGCAVPPGLPCPRVSLRVHVSFDEDIDPVTGADAANYIFHPVDDPEAPIPIAEVDWVWDNKAALTLSARPDTVDFLLTVFHVEDLEGYPMEPQSRIVQPFPDPSTVPDLPTPVLVSVAPNPFNPATVVSFELPMAGRVDLAAYDLAGRRVATIETGHLEAGRYERRWNAAGLASGSYLLRLRIGSVQTCRKVSLVR